MGEHALIVELFGLPGAGKTTLIRELESQLPNLRIRSSLQDRRLDGRYWGGPCKLLPAQVSEFCSLAKAVQLAFHMRPFLTDRFKHAVLLAAAQRRLSSAVRDSDAHVVLLDQWILQMVWSMCAFSEEFEPQKIARFVAAVCSHPARLIVFIDVDPEVAARRIGIRQGSGSRFDRIPVSQLERHLHTLNTTARTIVEAAGHGGCHVEWLSGQASINESVRRISEVVRTHASSCRNTLHGIQLKPFGYAGEDR